MRKAGSKWTPTPFPSQCLDAVNFREHISRACPPSYTQQRTHGADNTTPSATSPASRTHAWNETDASAEPKHTLACKSDKRTSRIARGTQTRAQDKACGRGRRRLVLAIKLELPVNRKMGKWKMGKWENGYQVGKLIRAASLGPVGLMNRVGIGHRDLLGGASNRMHRADSSTRWPILLQPSPRGSSTGSVRGLD